MKIFISYRRKDSGREVGRIRDRLKAEFGEQSVFRDLVDIPAGVDFRTVLDRETNGCDVMLVVIGPLWAGITDANGNKRLFDPGDYTRIEVETGLRRLEEGNTRVFPVLVLDAMMPSPGDIPDSLCELTNQNAVSIHDDPYFDFDMERLIRDIKSAGAFHPLDDIAYFEPLTIYIPDGPFLMGRQPGEGIPVHETPQHEVTLPAYCIGKFPVTNAQYEEFLRQTDRLASSVMGWEGQRVPKGLENHPVAGVTWYEALAYCQWLAEKTGRNYTLPTEAEWEKACRGGGTTIYPWGDNFDAARCHYGQSDLAPVDKYPPQNALGCFDFVGNVRQWTCTLWGEKRINPDERYTYPWRQDGRNDLDAPSTLRRVFRGGVVSDSPVGVTCSARSSNAPDNPGAPGRRMGFRIALQIG